MDINNKQDDQKLIEASINGDKEAFKELFIRYEGIIKQQLVNYTFSEFDSNDLLQETFIKTFLNLKRYDSRYSFGQWIRTIARNTFIDYTRRKESKYNTTPLVSTEGADASYNEDTPEEIIILRERNADLQRDLLSLPDNYRTILELRYYMGYSYDEIAEELNLPIGTVKTRLFRAKEALNKILQRSKP